jgi:acyl carrier protein
MGLDGVEMAMRTEERFGIVISDAEAEAVRTPGMLIGLVFSKLTASDERFCRSQRAFYIVRRALQREFGVERAAIIPDVDVRGLVRGIEEAVFWLKLKGYVGARSWPALDFSPALRLRIATASWLFFWVLLVTFACFGWAIIGISVFWWGTVLAAILAALFHKGLRERCSAFRVFIPSTIRTLRDLVPLAETADLISWSRAEVAREIRVIVLEVLGIKPEQYREDADFVKDLGMD